MQRLIVASSNQGKLRELEYYLEPLELDLGLLPDSSTVLPPETGETFVENALLKARAASKATGLPALSDDSGLVVDCLQGAPGVYSARYAGEHGDDLANNAKLLSALADVPACERGAHFCCALVLMRYPQDPMPLVATGRWYGSILSQPQGSGGFGYDPLFYVPKWQKSAASLSYEQKQQLSHRGQAMQQLIPELKNWLAQLA